MRTAVRGHMAEEVGKREKRAFLSHAHVDKTQADMLYDFLTRVAGIPVWYDTDDLPPGAAFAGRLFEGIENSRAAIILLSHESVDRGWVEEEYQAAQNQRANHKDFRVIPLRLDDVKPPGFLSNLSNIEIGKGNLDSASAARILQALYLPPHSTPNPGHGKPTYFSRGWRPSDVASAEALSEALSGAGLRLVSCQSERESCPVFRKTPGTAGGCPTARTTSRTNGTRRGVSRTSSTRRNSGTASCTSE